MPHGFAWPVGDVSTGSRTWKEGVALSPHLVHSEWKATLGSHLSVYFGDGPWCGDYSARKGLGRADGWAGIVPCPAAPMLVAKTAGGGPVTTADRGSCPPFQ